MQRLQLRGKHMPRALKPAQQGQVLVLAALLMVVLIALAGLAIDVGHQMDRYREAQNTADAAALAGADTVYLSSDQPATMTIQMARIAAAQVVQANGLSSQTMQLTFLDQNKNVITNPASLASASNIDYVAASVQDTFTPYFIQVLGITRSAVSTYAVAKVQWTALCELCVLNPTDSRTLNLAGTGAFSGTNVRVTVNSTASDALNSTGQGTFTDSGPYAQIDVVGGSNTNGGATISPQPVSGVQPVPDPLSWVPVPTGVLTGSCVLAGSGSNGNGNNPCSGTPPSVQVTSPMSKTINPGVYSSITVNGTLVLNPGIYVITGPFKVEAQATIIGNGVMLYLTCSTIPSSNPPAPYYQACPSGGPAKKQSAGYLSFAGGATVTLSAPTAAQAQCPSTAYDCPSTPPYATDPSYVPWQYTGLLIFQDRNNTTSLSLAGQSTVSPPASCTTVVAGASCIAGTIYAKAAPISITGGGTMQTALQSYVIGDSVSFGGNGGGGSQSLAMSFPAGTNAQLAPLNGLVQ